jgi:transposase
MARPSKLTKELQEEIITYIEGGNFPEQAARLVGVTDRTFYNWMKKGREAKTERGKFFQFFQAVKEAESFSEAYHVQNIRKASDNGKWTASAWFLERKFPERWSKPENINLNHSGGTKNELKSEVSVKARTAQRRKEIDNILMQDDDPVYVEDTGSVENVEEID